MVFVRRICSININAISCTAKKSLLKDFILNTDVDIILLQEVAFESFGFLYSHIAIVNSNVNGVGTAVLVRRGIPFSEVLLSPCGRITSVCVDNFNIINVYAASGSNRKQERDILFSSDIVPHLSTNHINIVAGDFNCILLESDSNSNIKNFSKGLESLVKSLKLLDIEKEKNHNVNFTFVRGISKSRLDRFYAPKDFSDKVQTVLTLAVPFSDHHAVLVKYEAPAGTPVAIRGRGFWKINPLLINNDGITSKIISIFQDLRKRQAYSQSFDKWWNLVAKTKIKQIYKSESFNINQQIHREKNFYYTCLKEIIQEQAKGNNIYDQMTFIKSKLLEIEHERLKNYSLKVSPASISSDETISLFQISSSITKQYSSRFTELDKYKEC